MKGLNKDLKIDLKEVDRVFNKKKNKFDGEYEKAKKKLFVTKVLFDVAPLNLFFNTHSRSSLFFDDLHNALEVDFLSGLNQFFILDAVQLDFFTVLNITQRNIFKDSLKHCATHLNSPAPAKRVITDFENVPRVRPISKPIIIIKSNEVIPGTDDLSYIIKFVENGDC